MTDIKKIFKMFTGEQINLKIKRTIMKNIIGGLADWRIGGCAVGLADAG
ncbi:MAG: hypothetical protein LBK71_08765 [Verrucomicrobiales bacterium]|nr:hypothetical protein [Verrucomicrobiales bacterium]